MYYYIILYAPFSDRPSSWLLAKYPTLSPSHLIKSPILALYIYIHIPLYHHHFPLNPLCMFGFPPCQLGSATFRIQPRRREGRLSEFSPRLLCSLAHHVDDGSGAVQLLRSLSRRSSTGTGWILKMMEMIYGSGKSWRMIFESLAICTGRYIHIVLTAIYIIIYIYMICSWLNMCRLIF